MRDLERLKVTAVVAAYIAILLWAYVAVVSSTYEYMGYSMHWPEPVELIWMCLLAMIPAVFIPLRLQRPSLLSVWWLYITVYIPSIIVPGLNLTLASAKRLPFDIAMLLCLGFLTLITSAKTLSLRPLAISPKKFWPVIYTVWGSCLIFVCVHFHFSSLLINLGSLFMGGSEYTIRSDFFVELSNAGRLLGYAAGQVAEAIDPFLIAYGLVQRRTTLIVVGVIGQLAIFTIVGSKSVFFSSAFLVIVFLLMKHFQRNFGVGLGLLLIAVILLSAGADRISNGISASSITTRRTLLEPGLLTGFYYEHYSQVPHAGLAYHISQEGKDVPSPPYEIGLVYFGDVNIEANANLWAQGFADFGMPGIFCYTLLLSAILWLYDSLAARQNLGLAILIVAMQAFAYSNSPPMTVLITHGGLATALLLWAAPSTDDRFVRFGSGSIQQITNQEFVPAIVKRVGLDGMR